MTEPDPAGRRDPDSRFLLANERTLLAWMRTALALAATGIGLLRLAPGFDVNGSIGLSLLLVGAMSGMIGLRRYRAADQAIRRGDLPPKGWAPEAIALGIFVLTAALFAVALVHELRH